MGNNSKQKRNGGRVYKRVNDVTNIYYGLIKIFLQTGRKEINNR